MRMGLAQALAQIAANNLVVTIPALNRRHAGRAFPPATHCAQAAESFVRWQ